MKKKRNMESKARLDEMIKDPGVQKQLIKMQKILTTAINNPPKRGRPKKKVTTSVQVYLDAKTIQDYVSETINEKLSTPAALIFMKIISLPEFTKNIENKNLKRSLKRIHNNVKSVKDIENLRDKYNRGKRTISKPKDRKA